MDEFGPTEPVATTSVAVTRPAPAARLARVGILGAAAAAIVAVGILIASAGSAPGGIFAATAATSGANGATNGEGIALDNRGPGRPGFGHGGHGFGAITVQAINGSSLSLATEDGWKRTIAVDSGTTYSREGTAIAPSDVKVGDEIRFRETRESDGSYSIDAVAVIPPHVAGIVTAVSGSTITLALRDGSSSTVSASAGTTYDVAGNASAKLSDIKPGMVLVARGTKGANGSLSATEVRAGNFGDFRHGRGPGHGPDGGDDDGDAPAPSASSSGSTN